MDVEVGKDADGNPGGSADPDAWMDTGIALEADALGKQYGRSWALRDCSFSLPAGHVAALVGPNGAGKTTLLSLAVGLLRPDAGRVRVFGRDPRDAKAVLGEIGFVAQDTPLYRDFSAVELIELGGRLNRRWDAALARERLAQLGIPPKLAVGKLSGGQRAQVALALALAKRPRLLLLDEPIASLDPLARREFMQTLMGAVGEHRTTVLLSSHLLADLERSCDFLVVLQQAHVQLAGEVDELLTDHCTLVGPRLEGEAEAAVAAAVKATSAGTGTVGGAGIEIPGVRNVAKVVRSSHTDRQSTLVVRTDGRPVAIGDPAWAAHDVSLEDLVLAYLAAAETRAVRTGWEASA